MKTRTFIVLLTGLFIATPPLGAQEARFFRIAGPVPATITETTPAGLITWTNLPTDGTFTVQTATFLEGDGDWVDWTQASATNPVTTLQVFAPNTPSGMALIPAGSFRMGDSFTEGGVYERPTHTVYVSAFYMDKYEVTEALWDAVKAYNGGNGYSYDYADSGQGEASNHPAHTMTWYDAVKWCNARSQKEGLVPCYYTDAGLTTIYKTGQVAPYVKWNANGYRLPTEAEWEKAARGGTAGKRFPWTDTDNITHSRANYNAGSSYPYDLSYPTTYHPTFNDAVSPYTSPAGYFAPNGYGLYDMAGNVWEWCWDWHSSIYYSSSPSSDPRGAVSGSRRVFRGGSWSNNASYCRTAYRSYSYPANRYDIMGFRSVRSAGQ